MYIVDYSISGDKGTRCEEIIEKYSWTYLSAGDWFFAVAQNS